MKKLKKKKKRSGKKRPLRYVRITPQRMRELEALAAKRNPRKTKKKSKAKARKTRRTSARRPARKTKKNISPILAALVEGAGYTIGREAVDSVTQKRKRKSKGSRRPKPRKIKRNPTHGVAVGSRSNPRFIAAGPKAQIHKLAKALRSALGRSRNVMVGRVKSRSR